MHVTDASISNHNRLNNSSSSVSESFFCLFIATRQVLNAFRMLSVSTTTVQGSTDAVNQPLLISNTRDPTSSQSVSVPLIGVFVITTSRSSRATFLVGIEWLQSQDIKFLKYFA